MFWDVHNIILNYSYSVGKFAGIRPDDLRQLPSVRRLRTPHRSWLRPILFTGACLILMMGLSFMVQWPLSHEAILEYYFDMLDMDLEQESCIFELNDAVVDLARPPVDCSICESVKEIGRVSAITPEIFEELYAYTGKFQDLDPFCVSLFQTKTVDISLNIACTDLYQPPK